MKKPRTALLFCIGFILVFFCTMAGAPLFAHAQTSSTSGENATSGDFCKITGDEFLDAIVVQIEIPGVTYQSPVDGKYYIKSLPCYIVGIYRYFAGAAGILATVMIVYGGIQYLTSFGKSDQISKAKDTILSAIIGLALALGSYVILYFINPNLTTLKLPAGIDRVDPIFLQTNWCDDTQYGSAQRGDPQYRCGATGVDENGDECFHFMGCYESAVKLNEPGTWMCWPQEGEPKSQWCQLMGSACGSTSRDNCDEVNRAYKLNHEFYTQTNYPYYKGEFEKFVCRAPRKASFNDGHCYLYQILSCPSGWERVNCKSGLQMKCWNRTTDQPESKEVENAFGDRWDVFCSDSTKAAQSLDAICCGKLSGIDCRTVCNKDEIPVDCSDFDKICGAGEICCQEVELKTLNE